MKQRSNWLPVKPHIWTVAQTVTTQGSSVYVYYVVYRILFISAFSGTMKGSICSNNDQIYRLRITLFTLRNSHLQLFPCTASSGKMMESWQKAGRGEGEWWKLTESWELGEGVIEAYRKLRGWGGGVGGISCTIYGCIHGYIPACIHSWEM